MSSISTSQAEVTTPEPTKSERLVSIDALRGFDMFWIIGGDSLAIAILTAGQWSFSPMLIEQLEHVAWEGFRFYDLIFPLFLFMVGCVLPFSLEKYRENPSAVYGRIVRRTILLVLCGLIVNGLLQFDWPNMRYAGVLQRIGISYGIAAFLYLLVGLRGRIAVFLGILIGYWLILRFVPSENGVAGDMSIEGNLGGYIDRMWLPGKIYPEYYGFGDNEGLLSSIPAVATALLGVFAGEWLRSTKSPWMKSFGLLMAGLLFLGLGYGWSQWFPIIKNLWTSSFVLVAGGWSLILLSLFYTVIDVLKWRILAWVWVVIGMNAITIYMLGDFVNFSQISQFFLGGTASLAGVWKQAVLEFGVVLAEWLVLYHLYRHKIFLRV